MVRSSNLTLSFSSQTSIEEELKRESTADVVTIEPSAPQASCLVMFAYISVALGDTPRLSSFYIASKELYLSCFLYSGSVGFFSVIGVKSTLIIMGVIPFLVLALLLITFDCLRAEDNRIGCFLCIKVPSSGGESDEGIGQISSGLLARNMKLKFSESLKAFEIYGNFILAFGCHRKFVNGTCCPPDDQVQSPKTVQRHLWSNLLGEAFMVNALPSADCAKDGHEVCFSSVDLNGIRDLHVLLTTEQTGKPWEQGPTVQKAPSTIWRFHPVVDLTLLLSQLTASTVLVDSEHRCGSTTCPPVLNAYSDATVETCEDLTNLTTL
ncbi:SSD domain-containing protein [Citrus sinensis]|uniref:SSD domain-containing protein n=1 Tax=Citrus sinensis TaxID=2711 RepID=A0ACB8L5H2_CITSI|nr:SSD domain-containing protein [Citrus sinensis]